MENYLKYLKEYLYPLRNYIFLACLIFVFAIFYGYSVAQTSPEEVKTMLDGIKKVYEPVFGMSPIAQFLFVVLNNGLTLLFIILLGLVFGVPPFMALLSNGAVLGIVAFFSKQTFSWSVFFLGTLPHGIIEIPVLILGCAVGLKIGKTLFNKVFKKQGEVKKELSLALDFFLKALLPLLAIAAAIEIFITANLLGV
ncbi:MAG: hypothetical protein AUJ31_01730 [Parcubacteria group bacterium CG1_02_39_15]|nr:MAG: hypothetical protein AUJ31_01730 [Parcubacteria group bacterium CG1_02_39_15]